MCRKGLFKKYIRWGEEGGGGEEVVWNIKQTIIIFIPVNEWIAFASTHKITNAGFVKNIYLQPLVVGWISIFKGVVKFNLSDLFFWVQFRRPWKRLCQKNLLLTLIAVTRIINLVRCILTFQYTILFQIHIIF